MEIVGYKEIVDKLDNSKIDYVSNKNDNFDDCFLYYKFRNGDNYDEGIKKQEHYLNSKIINDVFMLVDNDGNTFLLKQVF